MGRLLMVATPPRPLGGSRMVVSVANLGPDGSARRQRTGPCRTLRSQMQADAQSQP